MKRPLFREQQIAIVLLQREEGTTVEEVCRRVGISEESRFQVIQTATYDFYVQADGDLGAPAEAFQ